MCARERSASISCVGRRAGGRTDGRTGRIVVEQRNNFFFGVPNATNPVTQWCYGSLNHDEVFGGRACERRRKICDLPVTGDRRKVAGQGDNATITNTSAFLRVPSGSQEVP